MFYVFNIIVADRWFSTGVLYAWRLPSARETRTKGGVTHSHNSHPWQEKEQQGEEENQVTNS